MKANISKTLRSKLRDAFVVASMLLHWGQGVFGFSNRIPLTGKVEGLVDQIWAPLLEAGSIEELRDRLSRYKAVRGWLMSLLCANPAQRKVLRSNPPKGVNNFWQGVLDKWLGDIPAVERRGIMTALFSTRAVILPGAPDYTPITQASTKETPSYREYIRGFWKVLRYNPPGTKPPRGVKWSAWHLSSKQGPNGPAMLTLMRDFNSLNPEVRGHLEHLGGTRFKEALESLERFKPYITMTKIPTESGRLRKLASFGDLEGKTRVIAILDYFSQSVLRPLHFYLFQVLRKIPQDYTFNQGGFLRALKGWEILVSCDLSNATDRFPILLISEVLRGILPDSYVRSWEYIMVGLPFWTPEGSISYARGNPMGAYSSWASFAVTHHFVMYVAACRAGLNWRTSKYAILGDDILIGDRDLYREYRKILSDLDVPVSEAKTHVSLTTCEFAKRWVHQGEEITPFPIPALVEAGNCFGFLVPLFAEYSRKGYEVCVPSVTRRWVETWYHQRRKRMIPRRGFFTDIELKSTIAYLLIQGLRGEKEWSLIFDELSLLFPEHDFRWADGPWKQSFWSHLFAGTWVRASDAHMKAQIETHAEVGGGGFTAVNNPLDPQQEAQQAIMKRVMLGDEDDEDTSMVDSRLLPWLMVAGQLLGTADQTQSRIDYLLSPGVVSKDWTLYTRTLLLPNIGKVFKMRKYEVVKVVSGKLATELLQGFRRGSIKIPFPLENHIGGWRVEVELMGPLHSLETWEGTDPTD